VDDEPSLIESMKRHLRADFDITAAGGGDEALSILGKIEQPFAAIVSDQRMPGMDGIEFLSLAKDIAPDSVRIMLTGYADQDTAIEAVNQGSIFRFLIKPCQPHIMARALRDAVRQYELVTSERELLEKTLTGSIQALVDMLALASPVAFRRAARLRDLATRICTMMRISDSWQISAAATLSHIGYITLPPTVLEKHYTGRPLTASEEGMLQGQVEGTTKLLEKIPRLENVTRIIREFSTSRNSPAVAMRDPTSFGANLLRCIVEYDRMTTRGLSRAEALRYLSSHPDDFNADIVASLNTIKPEGRASSRRMVMIDALQNGMIVDEDVRTTEGMLLVPKGYVVNDTVRQRLRNFRLHDEVDGSIAITEE
jgi:CheY-like chemotaxis protein